ncbi:hypothetical protein WICPIJ_009626 [Wickerhamomyces pijperi]|uniref:Uncharacterized protein n=1 Tax=Wickerhamomyces pijperi TaxID=599730 RepID=A0A9P8PL18_WICPI|nr:hypothetical protein WICPIJ_009626 [Wickerhamomyces pijperi]
MSQPPPNSTNQSSISLEETNKLRISLGLKPIPIPTTTTSTNTTTTTSTTTEQYQTQQQTSKKNEDFKKKLELIKIKAENKRKLNLTKSILDEEDQDEEGQASGNDDWLSKIGMKASSTDNKQQENKKQKLKQKLKFSMNDTMRINAEDLNNTGVILTFKESSIYANDDDQEILQSVDRLNRNETGTEKDKKDQTAEKSRMEVYQERLNQESDQAVEHVRIGSDGLVVLNEEGEKRKRAMEESSEGAQSNKRKKISFSLDSDEDEELAKEKPSDYADVKPIKMKKLKKKSSTSTSTSRKKDLSDQSFSMGKVVLPDSDNDGGEQEQEQFFPLKRKLQQSKYQTPAQLAQSIKSQQLKDLQDEKEEQEKELKRLNKEKAFVVIDESTEFLSMIGNSIVDEPQTEVAPATSKQELTPETVIEQEQSSAIADEPSQSINFSGTGLASTLQFLQSRNAIQSSSQSMTSNAKEMKLNKIKYDIEERILREKMETDPAVKRMSKLEREDYLNSELQKLKSRLSSKLNSSISATSNDSNYNPTIKLSYHNSQGQEITSREAYKELSHKFHGNTNNVKYNQAKKGKLERRVQRGKEEREKEGRLLG